MVWPVWSIFPSGTTCRFWWLKLALIPHLGLVQLVVLQAPGPLYPMAHRANSAVAVYRSNKFIFPMGLPELRRPIIKIILPPLNSIINDWKVETDPPPAILQEERIKLYCTSSQKKKIFVTCLVLFKFVPDNFRKYGSVGASQLHYICKYVI